MSIVLEKTCSACPEQYDLHVNGEYAAYFRLRWGLLVVRVPDEDGDLYNGKVIYEHGFGDPWLGIFPSEKSRVKHMRKALNKILKLRGVSYLERHNFLDMEFPVGREVAPSSDW